LIQQSKALQAFKESEGYKLFKSDFEPLKESATNTLLAATPTNVAEMIQREQMVGELRQITTICNWFEKRHLGILEEIKRNKEDHG
jgi:hypothetical protein|tara:strand:- start:7054 stop:7311 length:258 start_codon:yes stop_codon:yes gene_type:complete